MPPTNESSFWQKQTRPIICFFATARAESGKSNHVQPRASLRPKVTLFYTASLPTRNREHWPLSPFIVPNSTLVPENMFPYACDMPPGGLPYYCHSKSDSSQKTRKGNDCVTQPRFHVQEKICRSAQPSHSDVSLAPQEFILAKTTKPTICFIATARAESGKSNHVLLYDQR